MGRRRTRFDAGIPEPLKVLLGLLVILFVAIGVSGHIDRVGRSAEADAEVLDVDFQPGEAKGAVPRG